MNVLSFGWSAFNETGKYTCATFEYAGILSYSIVKRGGMAVNKGIRKITTPVAGAISWPFEAVKDTTSAVFRGMGGHGETIKSLTEKLAKIEERLAEIEKYGVAAPITADTRKRKKGLAEDKRSVLKEILAETMTLKEGD